MRFQLVLLTLFLTLPLLACPDQPDDSAPPVVDEICDDAIDNDGDGATDCDDSECANLFVCKNPPVDAGPAHDAGPASDATIAPADGGQSIPADGGNGGSGPGDTGAALGDEICDDEIDNDGDLLLDCADPDCYGVGDCPGEQEICDDEIDNDENGQIDCDDEQCTDDPACGGLAPRAFCRETVVCLSTCEDENCQQACLAAGGEGSNNLAQALVACAVENECGDDLACVIDHCPTEVAACDQDLPV
jgi:hypothetical protein